jgi:hypothetical protein
MQKIIYVLVRVQWQSHEEVIFVGAVSWRLVLPSRVTHVRGSMQYVTWTQTVYFDGR